MRNYLNVGPVSIRLHKRNLAFWGYPALRIGGFSMGARTNDGDLTIASYHPRSSITWLWFVHLAKRTGPRRRWLQFADIRRGQWHDYIRLPFGYELRIGHQRRMNRTPRKPFTRIESLALRKQSALNDACPDCGGELGTAWECNRCHLDCRPLVAKQFGLDQYGAQL